MKESSYTRETADLICTRLSLGETLAEICRSEGMPGRTTVLYWVDKNVDGLADRYARARDRQLEYWADELLSISDDAKNDYMERNGNVELNTEHIQRSKLRSDNRKWLLSKLKPERYGDRVVNQHSGDPNNPITSISRVEVVLVSPSDQGSEDISTITATNALQSGVGRSREREIALLCERLDSESDC